MSRDGEGLPNAAETRLEWNKVIYKGVLTTALVRLDLLYKFFRRPCATVSVAIFLYFNSKSIKEVIKKVAHG